jgi:diguanylate cyclase (GGDEF)-like protein
MISTEPPLSTASDDFRGRLTVSMFERAPDAMLIIDRFSNVSLANSRAEELFQCFDIGKETVKANSLLPEWDIIGTEVIGSNSGSTAKPLIMRAIRQGDRGEFIAEVEPSVIRLDLTDYIGVIVRDVTNSYNEKSQLEIRYLKLQNEKTRLELLVKQDPLTQTLNRRGLENILSREVEFARRRNSSLLAAIVDLDNFKKVNDDFGHSTGDLVLRHVAGVLKSTVRAVDWVGRIGGDEFLILLPDTSLAKGANVAERVRNGLTCNPAMTPDGEIQQTASFGLVALPDSVCSVEEVLELTKHVLKESKSNGKNRVSIGQEIAAKSDTLFGADSGCVPAGMQCFFQPIVDLQTFETVGYEYLVGGPDGSHAIADEMFRRYRQNNTLTLLDLHFLHTAMMAAKGVEQTKICHFNLFPSTLLDIPAAKLLERIRGLSEDKRVCIELSARSMMPNPSCLLEPVREMKRQGISIGLSNVGCGHSSLEFLLYLEPDFIKLDPSLVFNICNSPDNQKCVRLLVELISKMSTQIVADGIENEKDLTTLSELGVQFGQGTFTGEPQYVELNERGNF